MDVVSVARAVLPVLRVTQDLFRGLVYGMEGDEFYGRGWRGVEGIRGELLRESKVARAYRVR